MAERAAEVDGAPAGLLGPSLVAAFAVLTAEEQRGAVSDTFEVRVRDFARNEASETWTVHFTPTPDDTEHERWVC